MTTQIKIRKRIWSAIFFVLSINSIAFAQLSWISSGQPSVWGNVYGVGFPTGIAGDFCNGNLDVYFKYDDAGNRFLRTTSGFIIKTKKDGVNDVAIGNVVEKFSEEAALDATKIIVYPNPVSDILIVKQENLIDGTFELYDSKGQQISTKKATLQTEIELAHLPSGFYLLILRSAKTTAQWKITKK
jgi:hypothetical protein